MNKKLHSNNNVQHANMKHMEHGFWLCHDDMKHFVSGNKNEYVMDLVIVVDTQPLKIGTNITMEKVLGLEYSMLKL
jgi:hypothetical protein